MICHIKVAGNTSFFGIIYVWVYGFFPESLAWLAFTLTTFAVILAFALLLASAILFYIWVYRKAQEKAELSTREMGFR